MSAPCNRSARYLVALDIADSALRVGHSPLLAAAAAALAPRWEDVRPFDGSSGPTWYDVQREDEEITEQFLLGSLARGVAALGPEYGVWIENPTAQGRAGLLFALRLLREARETGLALAFTSRVVPGRDDELTRALAEARVVSPPTGRVLPIPRDAALLLAIASQGAPVEALVAAGGARDEIEHRSCPGPADEAWAALPPDHAATVLTAASEAERRDACLRLWNAWPPDGWGYLRRGALALESGDVETVLREHSTVLRGSTAAGREHLLERYELLARCPHPDAAPFRQASLISAARLSERRGGEESFAVGIGYLRAALELEQRPPACAALLYELANRHALHRTPAGLVEARRLYESGFAMLDEIDDAEQRVRSEITFLNGLALVEYLERRGPEALELERRAQAIAEAHARSFPTVASWALPLLNTNTAKLLERRFDDLDAAMTHLRRAFEGAREEHREHLAVELARMLFDLGEDEAVVEVLEPFFADRGHVSSDERDEYLGRMMLAISLVRRGRLKQAARQRGRLRDLNRALASTSGSSVIDLLEVVLVDDAADRESVNPVFAR